MADQNVVPFPNQKANATKSDASNGNNSSSIETFSLSKHLSSTIDDDLIEQLREQSRRKHGLSK
jgi:hypothetical protein